MVIWCECAAKCNVPELINLQTAKTFGFVVPQIYWPAPTRRIGFSEKHPCRVQPTITEITVISSS
jgi:hypothetical protein